MPRQFRLRDLLVFITCSCVFFAFGFPLLAKARMASRLQMCAENMRRLGVGFETHAQRDAQVRLSTGPADYHRDGCPDSWGWIADALKVGAEKPGELLCPSNPMRGTETLLDLAGMDPINKGSIPNMGANLARYSDGACKNLLLTVAGIPTGGTLAPSKERDQTVRDLMQAGINSNYTASWFFARATCKLTNDGTNNYLVCRGDQTNQTGAMPGLPQRMVEKSRVSSAAIPLLADGGALPGRGRSVATFSRSGLHSSLWEGSSLVASAGPGAAMYDPAADALVPFSSLIAVTSGNDIRLSLKGDILPLPSTTNDGGVDVDGDGTLDAVANDTHGGSDRRLFLQDLRALRPVHWTWGKEMICNVLTADGAVKSIADPNGDGYLNPGFPIQGTKNADVVRVSETGYANSVCEVAPATIFTGPFIDDSWIKSCFCCKN